ncbi:MAG: PilZ domain-containing protein [Planctomycetota bacterium]
MSKTGIERRRAHRTEADIPIRLIPRDDAHPARLVNISTSGICCTFGEAINEMTMVGITLELPGAATGTEIKGAVVRCAKCRNVTPPTYELGIFFTELSPDSRHAIEGFVDSRLSENAGK